MFRLIFPLQISLKRKEIIIDIMPAAEGGSVLSIPLSLLLFVCLVISSSSFIFLSPK